MGITIIPDEAFPRTRGDRPTEVDGNLIDRMVPPHTRGTANCPACRGVFPGLFGHGSSVSKKSNDFTPEGLHNTFLSDVKTAVLIQARKAKRLVLNESRVQGRFSLTRLS